MDPSDLNLLLEHARRMAAGDFSTPMEIAGLDATAAELAAALNQIAARFREQAAESKERRTAHNLLVDRHRRLIEHFPGVIYIIRVGRDGAYQFPFVSANAWEILGVRAKDIMRDSTLLTGIRHPDDVRAMDEEILVSGLTGKVFRFEVRHLVRGEYRWFECLSQPARRPDGRAAPDGFGFMLDITDRKATALALAESEQRYRLVVDHIADVVVVTDASLKPTFVSPAAERLFGYTPEEVMALGPISLMTPESFKTVARTNTHLLTKGRGQPPHTVDLNLDFRRKDGTVIACETRSRFLRGPDGAPHGVLVVIRERADRQEPAQLEDS